MILMIALDIFVPYLKLLRQPVYIEETSHTTVLITAILVSILKIYCFFVTLGSFIYIRMRKFEEENVRSESAEQHELGLIERLLSIFENSTTGSDLRISQLPEESNSSQDTLKFK